MKVAAWMMLAATLLAPVDSLDWRVQRAVQAARRPFLERPMRAITSSGRPAVVLGALLAIVLLDPVAGPAMVREAVLVLLPTNGVVEGVKLAVGRTRPDGEHRRSNASFPSGHAANAAALAYLFARRWKRGTVPFWVAAGLVCGSRIYLNRHFMSDVLVGAAIGVGIAWVVAHLGPRVRRKSTSASMA